jgi:DNA-binding response OmpR family regulator
VLSARSDIADVAEQIGADAYLAKPFDLKELVALLALVGYYRVRLIPCRVPTCRADPNVRRAW